MPRTKIQKKAKRNRETAECEDKIREFDALNDKLMFSFQTKKQFFITEIDNLIRFLLVSTSQSIFDKKLGDYLEMIEKGISFSNFATPSVTAPALPTVKISNPNDEGYLTEDSTNSAPVHVSNCIADLSMLRSQSTQLQQQQQQQPPQQQHRGRTPGPLSSARARKTRRSHSAGNGILGSAIKPNKPVAIINTSTSNSDHLSRSRLRTPMSTRKALSADRGNNVTNVQSPPCALLRWAKPGEFLLSKQGSPVVSQVPMRIANVNIPTKDGVLQMHPKLINDLQPEVVESINSETLQQLRTLHANLDKIMTLASKK